MTPFQTSAAIRDLLQRVGAIEKTLGVGRMDAIESASKSEPGDVPDDQPAENATEADPEAGLETELGVAPEAELETPPAPPPPSGESMA